MQRHLVLIAHNLRSTHNVGSLLRTAEGLGLDHVYLTGYTPYPRTDNDARLPHEATKIHKQIQKTALGAELTQAWTHEDDITAVITALRADGYLIVALEQTPDAQELSQWQPVEQKIALLVGREVEGLEASVIEQAQTVVQIPMLGHKESFNVVQAAAMALFYLRFIGA